MGKKPVLGKRWNVAGFAFWGTGFGGLAVVAHEAHAIVTGGLHDVEPFGHIMAELAAAGLGGALLIGAIAWTRNRIVSDGDDR